MKTTHEYIDAAKKKLGAKNDSELCRMYGWKQATFSNYKGRKDSLNNTHATQIAETLNINPLIIIADMEAERAKTEDKKNYWRAIAKKYAGVAAALIIVATMLIFGNENSSKIVMIASIFLAFHCLHNINMPAIFAATVAPLPNLVIPSSNGYRPQIRPNLRRGHSYVSRHPRAPQACVKALSCQ